ncbi:hypothetical protein, partial [Lactonifactor sp. BIOML-A1]|uniref:hypothetical protein n=1 Tax=Lactonifactor sp. BIOML-A1 TaxID=2584654 RepID=UPI0019D5092F
FWGVRYDPHSVRSETHQSPLGSAECKFIILMLNILHTVLDLQNFLRLNLYYRLFFNTFSSFYGYK